MPCLAWLAAGALLLAETASGNVIVFNDAYCDMVLYERRAQTDDTFLRVVHARSVQKLMGYQGLDMNVRIRSPGALHLEGLGAAARRGAIAAEIAKNPVLLSWTVPAKAPGNLQRTFSKPDFSHKNTARFYDFYIPPKGEGWDCSEIQYTEPADLKASALVLSSFVVVLTGSFIHAALSGTNSGAASWPEVVAWAGITVFYYVHSAWQVVELSGTYQRFCAESQLNTNIYEGDKVWGLHDDTPSISQLFAHRRWDRKDVQLRGLVESFPMITLFAVAYLVLKYFCERIGFRRHVMTLLLGAGYVGFLHEFKLLLPLSYAILNYLVVRWLAKVGGLAKTLTLPALWVLGLAGLFLAGGDLSLAQLFRFLLAPVGWSARAEATGRWLDGFKGELDWTTTYRFWVLRCISWGVDFQKSSGGARENVTAASTSKDLVSTDDSSNADELAGVGSAEPKLDERGRVESHRKEEEYQSFILYLAYLFYAPLYMTGPIITFNSFASYMQTPQRDIVGRDLLMFWARWLMNAVLFVGFGHFMYTFAIVINGPLHAFPETKCSIFDSILNFGQDGEKLVWFSFWSLKGLWFKFLVIWRFARGWALADGVAPPENMERCMCNNYAVRDFWRGWHRSFNRWLVRYIYIPLGGSRGVSLLRQFASSAVVFTFVAIWHEPSLLHGDSKKRHLLTWGWMFALFLLPELLVERLYRVPSLKDFLDRRPLLTRHLTALGGACCIVLLVTANLVGYSYGIQGLEYLKKALFQSWKVQLFYLAHIAWFAAKTQLMLQIRQCEARSSGLAKIADKSY
eukprot:TRINITY_DN96571_c0_g1_i1.p1 TRINITY_DN96571_c0_g1~~TRINITY_DN96571_c0_g1_i1.p1  ORF type:complete len:848 (+),score=118.60 TRINITY_DN96571_c0_g1_i1:156-2546(+)